QRRAIHLRIAADVVVQAGMKRLAVAAVPGLRRLVDAVDEHLLRVPVRGRARQVVAAFEQKYTFAGRREPLHERRAARSRSDHDHVVVTIVWHAQPPVANPGYRVMPPSMKS